MGKIFLDDNQLEKWVQAAEGIAEDFHIEKALGYLTGERCSQRKQAATYS